MAQEFLVPALGDSIAEVEISEWHVAVGDTVAIDQPVVTVETDKSEVVVPCPFEGTVLSLGGDVGDVMEVGQVLVVIGGEGEEAPAAAAPAAPAAEAAPEAPAAESAAAPRRAGLPDLNPVQRMRAKALPKVRKAARDHGIDLDAVKPSGAGGEILLEDLVRPVKPSAFSQRTERMSKVRRTISERMTEAWTTTPMMSGFFDAEGQALLDARRLLSDRFDKKVPLEALLIPMVISALEEYPVLNATLDGDEVTYHGAVHMGVAMDTPEGLLVPVVRDADRMTVEEITDELARLVDGARNRTLKPEEMSGQTFTISNLGAAGGFHSVAILPKGTAGFVSIGRGRPTVRMKGGSPVEVPLIPLSITADHRIVDGAPAARFMSKLVENIENPLLAFV